MKLEEVMLFLITYECYRCNNTGKIPALSTGWEWDPKALKPTYRFWFNCPRCSHKT